MTFPQFTKPFPKKPTTPKFKDVEGRVFGHWSVVAFAGTWHQSAYWFCVCSNCGGEYFIRGSALILGHSTMCRPCAWQRSVTHGMRRTSTYRAWSKMRERCLNPNTSNYSDYGGRGIQVCERWNDFSNFLEDMGVKPGREYSLDRINVNGDYEPSNCRWATQTVQANNRRDNYYIEWRGRRQTLMEWSRELGMNRLTLRKRLVKGWDIERAMITPVSSLRKRKKEEK